MKVTLLINTYNRPDFLSKVLIAASMQSRPPDEVVVADDGSQVDMVSAIRRLVPELRCPVLFVTQANNGFRAARSRNNGIRLATGSLVLFIDQDILIPRDFVKTFVNSMRPREWLVSYPVRLTKSQTDTVTDQVVRSWKFVELPTTKQLCTVRRLRRKDRFYYLLHGLGLRSIGPKLRSGAFCAWREHLLEINGFDEMYRGWGNEDDDLGHRLYAQGVNGRHVTLPEFPVHLYHAGHTAVGVKPNKAYYTKRVKEIRRGDDIRALYGIENSLGEDMPVVMRIS